MKQLVRCAVIYLTLAVLLGGSGIGCSAGIQDKPLPMSQENMVKFIAQQRKESASIAPSPSQDEEELFIGTYKVVIEKRMGYSFDKTVRSTMLFGPAGARQVMGPVIKYVFRDPKRALDKGFISQRTFDIIDIASKAKAELTKNDEEFLGFVMECQNNNNGICDSKLLFSVLAAHNALPDALPAAGSSDQFKIAYMLEQKHDTTHMGINGWITGPDGQPIFDSLWSPPYLDASHKFVVNKNQIDVSKRFANMLAEEKMALSQ